MKCSKQNSEHYTWGKKCSGWHLVKTQALSVIQEIMPPGTQEKKHHHELAQQFFFILNGTAHFEVNAESIEIQQGEGIHIQPMTNHLIINKSDCDLEFLVISQPTTRGDRIDNE